ncbi:MAG: DNA-processing protein DprA [Verrucomicrobiota bacterium]|nr:DNA-processing protein DprA [Verrucomicrobiota bacterium]
MQAERMARLILNMVPGLGPVRFAALLERFGSAASILGAKEPRIAGVPGIGPVLADAIVRAEETTPWRMQCTRAEKLGVEFVIPGDPGYPEALQEIHDPPILLYRWGAPCQGPAPQVIGVVGSRRTTIYGQDVARRLAMQLAEVGFVVVSGLARGIDTAAHRGAIQGGGLTWAVLGTGVDVIYPEENAELAVRIREQGVVLSEFPLGSTPDRRHFPMRNRILAGSALGVVVVEADRRSGALITARQALDQGRLLFAVPGKITSPLSRGPHALIKQGAKLVEDVEDILEEFEYLFPPRRTGRVSAAELDAGGGSAVCVPISDDPDEQVVLNLLSSGRTLLIDEIVAGADLELSKVVGVLFRLQLKRHVRQLPGQRFTMSLEERIGPDA